MSKFNDPKRRIMGTTKNAVQVNKLSEDMVPHHSIRKIKLRTPLHSMMSTNPELSPATTLEVY